MDVNKLTAMASRLSISQLQQAMRDGSLPPYVGMPILQQKVKEVRAMKNAQGAAQPKPPTVAQQVEGEAQQANIEDMMRQRAAMMQGQMAGTGGISDMLRKPEPEAMAKGGEVKRFAVAGVVPGLTYQQALQIINNPTASPEQKAQAQQVIAQQSQPAPATPQPTQQPVAAPQVQPQGLTALYNDAIAQNPIVTAEQARKQREEYLGPNTGIASLREDVNKMKDEATKDKEQAGWMALMKAGLATMAGTSPYALTNIGQGAQAGVTDFMDAQKEYRKALEKQRDLSFKLDSAERQEKMDTFKYGEDSEKASRSANTALKIGQAKEENETRLKEAELDLRKQSNAISAASAAASLAETKRYHDLIGGSGSKLSDYEGSRQLAMSNPTAPQFAKYFQKDAQGNPVFDDLSFHKDWVAKQNLAGMKPADLLKIVETYGEESPLGQNATQMLNQTMGVQQQGGDIQSQAIELARKRGLIK